MKNCNCPAYAFPHRPNSGKCQIETLMLMAKDAGYPMDQEDAELYMDDFGDMHDALRAFVQEIKSPHPASVYY